MYYKKDSIKVCFHIFTCKFTAYHWPMTQSPTYLPTILKINRKLAMTIYCIDYRAQAFLAFLSRYLINLHIRSVCIS